MAISQAEARRAVQAALEYWVEKLELDKLAIDDMPRGHVAPIILSKQHRDPVTQTVIQVGGLLFLSENIEATQKMLRQLAASITQQTGGQPPNQ